MRHFEEGLNELKSTLVGMAGLAEEQVRKAVRALIERSTALAEEVEAGDEAIDDLEVRIDEMALNLLALQQPMARDLRFITISMQVSSTLERVGDHAENIANAVKQMVNAPPFPVLPEIEEMVRLATDMLGSSLDAFIRGDTELARQVLRNDDRVDELHENNFRILLTHMMEDPRRITGGMDLLLISGNLERIADLATNISEETIFLVEGRSVKHKPRNAGTA